jgi:predicted anti-sigma-YlaC factor YlaD
MKDADNNLCRSEDIAAYLDGELSGDEVLRFENHVSVCKHCVDELQNQKRLLNELDLAFGLDDKALPLPQNFTKVIKTTAESDMNGLRQKKEKSRALRLCVVLAVLSFALLGWVRLSDSVFTPLTNLVRIVSSFMEIIGRVIYDAGLGVCVITRAVSRHFIFESNPLNYLLFLLFMLSIVLLSRLVRRAETRP